ncbi:hypothetical protein NKI89_19810 [Mesorhizobium sp. M0309]|uniref:hypothetical protein n=1 Tax=Mesorhizobium sp. M0309 TaxID=2956933 RepID=UPI00333DBEB6
MFEVEGGEIYNRISQLKNMEEEADKAAKEWLEQSGDRLSFGIGDPAGLSDKPFPLFEDIVEKFQLLVG